MELTADQELQKRLVNFNTQQQKLYQKIKTHQEEKPKKIKEGGRTSAFSELWDNLKCLKLLKGRSDKQYMDLHMEIYKKIAKRS